MPYRERTARRVPSRLIRRLNAAVATAAALGLGPRGTVALETVGRRTGRRRRTAVVVAEHERERYLVSLGGESAWVRNVRAAGGSATIRRGRRRPVHLVEVPVDERAPFLRSYASRRRTSRPPERIAREYFGVSPRPTLAELEPIAAFYPVFRIDRPRVLGAARATSTAPVAPRVGRAGRCLAYGVTGWAVDSVFVWAHTGRRRPSSLLNLPVYALAQPLFEPVHDGVGKRSLTVRAGVYAVGIAAVEYASGRVLRLLVGRAPWDYSGARFAVGGLTRLDYLPLWAVYGLGLERLHDVLTGPRA